MGSIRYIVCAFAIALPAYAGSHYIQRSGVMWGDVTNGLKAGLSFTTELDYQNPRKISATIWFQSKTNYHLIQPQGNQLFDVSVRDPSGRLVSKKKPAEAFGKPLSIPLELVDEEIRARMRKDPVLMRLRLSEAASGHPMGSRVGQFDLRGSFKITRPGAHTITVELRWLKLKPNVSSWRPTTNSFEFVYGPTVSVPFEFGDADFEKILMRPTRGSGWLNRLAQPR